MAVVVNSGLTSTQEYVITGGATNFPTAATGQTIISKSNTKAGSAIVAGTGLLLHTVTATKTFYLSEISFSNTVGGTWDVRDNTAVAGTPKICARNDAGTTMTHLIFTVPVAFTSGVFVDVAANGTTIWTLSGWEQ